MYIEAYDHLGNPVRIPVTRVVVYDDQGNPVCLTVQRGPAWLQSSHAGDKNFPEMLEQLGIRRSVVVTRHDLRKLQAPSAT